jgi:hypothetical protein
MPKTVIKLDSQQLVGLERCARYYEYSFIKSLEPKIKAAALNKGGHLSSALELYYKAKMEGKPFNDCFNLGFAYLSAAEFFDGKTEKESAQSQQLLLVRKFAEYCNYYHNEKEWPIAVESGFSKNLYEDDSLLIIYEGKPDLVVANPRGSNDIYPFDHKSESRRNELHGFSNQFLGYAWALEADKLVVNYIGLQESFKPEEAFLRVVHRYSKADIEDWRNNVVRNVKEFIHATSDGYYPKKRSACDTKYGLCRYAKLCDTQIEWTRQQREEQFFQVREEVWSAWK